MKEIDRIYQEMTEILHWATDADNDTLKDNCFVPTDQLRDWADKLWVLNNILKVVGGTL